MRSSLVHHFKNLISKIHPPLPLGPRESQKLVGLLKASHKKQLDERFPESKTGQSEATNAHFNALLASPLFNAGQHEFSSFENGKPANGNDSYDCALSNVHQILRYLDCSIAAGTMTLQKLLSLLPVLTDVLAKLHFKERIALLMLSQAGEKIRHWLWASGNDESKEFLENRRFANLLAPMLVNETHEKFLWKWFNDISEMVSHPTIPGRYALEAQDQLCQLRLLKQIIKRRAICGAGAADACSAFLDIFNRFSRETESTKLSRLRFAGFYLYNLFIKDVAAIEPALFEAFVASGSAWGLTEVYKSRLLLHHPQGPRPDYAMRFLRKLDFQEVETVSQSLQYAILQLALETTTVMLEQEAYADAEWLMKFAKVYFPNETMLPSEVTARSTATSPLDVSQFTSTIGDLVLQISTTLQSRQRARTSQDQASSMPTP